MQTEFCTRRSMLEGSATVLATIGTAGCLIGQSSTAGPVTMTDDLAFEPKTVRIASGATVTWKNTSAVDHTVTAYGDEIPDGATYFASGGFQSERAARNNLQEGLVAPGDTYEHTFDRPGTYDYFCIPHESSGMVGTVEVKY